MAEFSAVFLYSIRAVKLGYKPLFALFLCQFRPHAPDMGLRVGAVYITLAIGGSRDLLHVR